MLIDVPAFIKKKLIELFSTRNTADFYFSSKIGRGLIIINVHIQAFIHNHYVPLRRSGDILFCTCRLVNRLVHLSIDKSCPINN